MFVIFSHIPLLAFLRVINFSPVMGFSFRVVTFLYFMFLFYCFGDSSPILRFFEAGPLISYFFFFFFFVRIRPPHF